MNDKEQDPQLQAPQEANTGKHINFMETEEQDANNTGSSGENDNDSPTKKAWKEMREERKNNQQGENE